MQDFRRTALVWAAVLLFAACLVPLPAFSAEEESWSEGSAEAILVDLFLLRPVGIVATVFGTALFLVALPFTAAGRNTDEAARKLVLRPAHYTFTRPLGQIEGR